MTIHLNTDIKQIQKDGARLHLSDDADFELTTDLFFGATGRLPNTEHLNLNVAGVQVKKDGIQVNDYIQTTNPAIYAMSDVLSKSNPN